MKRVRALTERDAWICLGLAMAVAVAVNLWLGRGARPWTDELVLYFQSPKVDFDALLVPHLGHFIPFTKLYYRTMFELFGGSYLPFRIAAVGTVLVTVLLTFVYLKRRVPPFVALGPCLILLFFGSDTLHVLVGNAFVVLLPVSCGIGALLLLERDTRPADAFAAALLCLGIFTYSVSLAFVAAAGALILLGPRRWARVWVAALPAAIYATWWVWQKSKGFGDPLGGASPEQILLLPSWAYQQLSAVLGSLSGFDYPLGSDSGSAGSILAAAAAVGLGWTIYRGRTNPGFWAIAAAVVVLWVLGTLTAGAGRTPDSARYLFPGSVAALLLAGEALRGVRWPGRGVAALYVVVAAGLAVNLYTLGKVGHELRDEYSARVAAATGALQIAGEAAAEDFTLPTTGNSTGFGSQESPLTFPFGVARSEDRSTTGAYREAAERYGALGYDEAQIEAASEAIRAEVDADLAGALGLHLEPVVAPAGGCEVAEGGEWTEIEPPPGGVVLIADRVAAVSLRRFADEEVVELGDLGRDEAAELAIPVDNSPRPWSIYVRAPRVQVCEVR